jgi:hypothetical protein
MIPKAIPKAIDGHHGRDLDFVCIGSLPRGAIEALDPASDKWIADKAQKTPIQLNLDMESPIKKKRVEERITQEGEHEARFAKKPDRWPKPRPAAAAGKRPASTSKPKAPR